LIEKLLKFFNSIQLHYGKLNSVNETDIQLFDEEALIKLSIEHGSVEKIFEFLILKYEKGVDINEEYINKVFSEYKIDIDQANSLLSKIKQPKEPSFSKKALLKTPDFSKSKFDEIAKPSFSNTSKSQNKIENDKVNGNPKNTDIKKNKTLKEHWNSWSNVQKTGYVVLCIVIFGVFSNIFNSSDSTNSVGPIDICRCLTEPGTTEWYKKTRVLCDRKISDKIGVPDWGKVNFSRNPVLNARWESLKRSCGK